MKLQSAKDPRINSNFAYDKFQALDSEYAQAEASTMRTRNASATYRPDSNLDRPTSGLPIGDSTD